MPEATLVAPAEVSPAPAAAPAAPAEQAPTPPPVDVETGTPDAILTRLAELDKPAPHPLRANELSDYQDKSPSEAVSKIYQNQQDRSSDPDKDKGPSRYGVDENGVFRRIPVNELGVDITDDIKAKEAAEAALKAKAQKKGFSFFNRNKEASPTESALLERLNQVETNLIQQIAALKDKLTGATHELAGLKTEVVSLKQQLAEQQKPGQEQPTIVPSATEPTPTTASSNGIEPPEAGATAAPAVPAEPTEGNGDIPASQPDTQRAARADSKPAQVGEMPEPLKTDADYQNYKTQLIQGRTTGEQNVADLLFKINNGEVPYSAEAIAQAREQAVAEAADKFVQEHPDKAKQYAEFDPQIKAALEKQDQLKKITEEATPQEQNSQLAELKTAIEALRGQNEQLIQQVASLTERTGNAEAGLKALGEQRIEELKGLQATDVVNKDKYQGMIDALLIVLGALGIATEMVQSNN